MASERSDNPEPININTFARDLLSDSVLDSIGDDDEKDGLDVEP